MDITDACDALKIDLRPIWTSRDDPRLQTADAFTKGFDSDNWRVPRTLTAELQKVLGLLQLIYLLINNPQKQPNSIHFSLVLLPQGLTHSPLAGKRNML